PKKGISFSGFTQDLEDEYTIKEECVFKIIDAEASNRSKEDLEVFYNKVNQLRIAPRINTDQQKQIWSSWIKAQELIINRHSSPIKITRIPTPIPITDNKGTIFRYETRIRIPRTKSSGFGILEERMAEEPFNIEQPSFSPDGSIQLAYDNIVRGVDAIIKNELSDRFERESNIACILKINTPRLCDRISAKLDNKFKVFQRTEKKQILVKSNISDFLLLEKMKGMGFIQIGYNARFEILNHGDDLTKHEETIKKYRLGFGKGASASRGFVFPEPNKGNIFSYWEKEKWEIVCHYKSLCCIYGKENIIQGDFIVFKSFSNLNEEDFNSAGEDYWQDLKKDFYNLPFDVGVRESDSIISFDFRDKKDLEDKFRQLKQLGKIEERLSPLHEEFKFKIRLRLIVQKTERELFDEKLKYL
ncbi:MAG: hypothetical protein ACPG5P_07235, partial [Saprospiraceae bacterium]